MADHRDDFIIAIRYALLKKGAKQKFSLFFLIILSILIITLDKIRPPFMTPVKAILNDFVYHVSVASAQPVKLRNNIIQKITKHYDVMGENIYLKQEMEYLKKQKFNNAFLSLEKEILKQALDLSINKNFEQKYTSFSFQA